MALSTEQKAQILKDTVENASKEAQSLLKEAVDSGDIRRALSVFEIVNDLLPRNRWIIREDEYPLVRAHLDTGWVERYQSVTFTDTLEEEFYIVKNDPLEGEDPWDEEELEKAHALAWEVVRNGKSGCTWDW